MRGLQIDKVEEKDQKKRKKAMEKQAIQGFRRKSLGRKLTDDEKDQRKAARKPIFKEIYRGVWCFKNDIQGYYFFRNTVV